MLKVVVKREYAVVQYFQLRQKTVNGFVRTQKWSKTDALAIAPTKAIYSTTYKSFQDNPINWSKTQCETSVIDL